MLSSQFRTTPATSAWGRPESGCLEWMLRIHTRWSRWDDEMPTGEFLGSSGDPGAWWWHSGTMYKNPPLVVRNHQSLLAKTTHFAKLIAILGSYATGMQCMPVAWFYSFHVPSISQATSVWSHIKLRILPHFFGKTAIYCWLRWDPSAEDEVGLFDGNLTITFLVADTMNQQLNFIKMWLWFNLMQVVIHGKW